MRRNIQIRKKLVKPFDSVSKKTRTFVELYGRNKELIEKFADFLRKSKEEYNLEGKDVLTLIERKDMFIGVPISIFRNSFSPLEAVVQYLKEEGYRLKEISLMLNRSNKTIWTTYNNAIKKGVKLEISDELFVPLSVVSDRKLSTLENICKYLKEESQFSITKIGNLLSRNKNTIWTAYHRAKKKRESEKINLYSRTKITIQ